MLPNRFVGPGRRARVQHGRRLALVRRRGARLPARPSRPTGRKRRAATVARSATRCAAILDGHVRGTRYGIRVDEDGLLAAGEPGVQLTWMDAKVGDWVVTPRIGKPVEIQALWLNALRDRRARSPASYAPLLRARACGASRDALLERRPRAASTTWSTPITWPARLDAAVAAQPDPRRRRPAVPAARRATAPAQVVDAVERRLWTPLGLRTLAPGRATAIGRATRATCRARDGAYHQGTVWPWLLGPFVEAWVRVRGDAADARREARRRFLEPLLAHLDEAGLGHISEIADAEPPHTPRGCPVPGVVGGRGAAPRSQVLRGRARRACRNRQAVSRRSWHDRARLARHWPSTRWRPRCSAIFMISACLVHRAAGPSRLAGSPAVPDAVRAPAPDRPGHGRHRRSSLIYSPWGKQSGAHFNPAITLTFYPAGQGARRGTRAAYIGAQFAGAAVGVLSRSALLGAPCWPTQRCTSPSTAPGPAGVAVAFVAEVVISFLLMSVVLRVSNHARLARLTGVCAGVLVALVHHRRGAALRHEHEPGADPRLRAVRAATGPRSGSTSPRRRSGMLAAAELYLRRSGGAGPSFCAKLHHQNAKRCIFCEATGRRRQREPFASAAALQPRDRRIALATATLEGERRMKRRIWIRRAGRARAASGGICSARSCCS